LTLLPNFESDSPDNANSEEVKVIRAKDHTHKLSGPKVIGKIELPLDKPVKSKIEREKEERLARDKMHNERRKQEKELRNIGQPSTGNPKQDPNKPNTQSVANQESEEAKRKRKRKRKTTTGEVTPNTNQPQQNSSGSNQQRPYNNQNSGYQNNNYQNRNYNNNSNSNTPSTNTGGGNNYQNRNNSTQNSGNTNNSTGQRTNYSNTGNSPNYRGNNNNSNNSGYNSNVPNNNNTNSPQRQGGNTGTGNSPNYRGNNNNNSNNSSAQKTQTGSRAPANQKEVKDRVKNTMFEIGKGASRKRQNFRREKRANRANIRQMEEQEKLAQSNIIEVTEFLTANELANMMDVQVNQVIFKCMQLGMIVSINQRINADVIQLIAEEFGFEVRFMSLDESFNIEEIEDLPETLVSRAPIVTVMGHVDHGKTSLLDYIRKANVIAGEAGGITQHIGAYEVELDNGRKIAFLDTPGHEAFTAMRARGAQVTDIAIIVIAADDQVMPQTREAINHAQAAGVPMVFAINKIDKDGANPEKIKEQLAGLNLLVEDWGGKYQCQEIAAKFGKGINELLEKVLLEADILNLKANPNRGARGTVIEARLDKGRGVVATVLVQSGTLKIGDVILANSNYGRVKALFDERSRRVMEAGPSTPVQILGLDGVPQAGDKFLVMDTDREARELATKRQQLLREQTIRMQKHITLEEIARRSALGDFKELNIIVKGDVDGSVEALSDSLIKLSTEEVALRIIMKGVGQISESDVLLASASNAIIIGFQVRPSPSARKLIQQESIDVRIYSIIYNAINEVRDALEGLLRPTIEEETTGVAEVRDVFKISKVGTIAGCKVTEGSLSRNSQIRLVRDGIVLYTGKLSSLKRFKDDAKEVHDGYECGMGIENYNDLKVGDLIEAFTIKETKRKLD